MMKTLVAVALSLGLGAAGHVAKLDLYDGLPHCFTFMMPQAEESKIALAKQAAWFSEHLKLD